MSRTKIIGEVGTNHLGDYGLIQAYISEAKAGNLDILKFQGFKAKNLVLESGYTEGDREYYKKCEVDFVGTVIKCTNVDVQPLITAFDLESLKDIANAMRFTKKKIVKIASPDMLSYSLIDRALKLFDEVIISTGMHSTIEISRICSYLRSIGEAHKVVLMHCVSEYPTQLANINMVRVEYLKEMGFRWGFSDHSEGLEASMVAIAMGAEYVEKHVTISRHLPSRDSFMSAKFSELSQLVAFAEKAEPIRGAFFKKELTADDYAMRTRYVGKWGANA